MPNEIPSAICWHY